MVIVSEKDVINFNYIQIFTLYNYTIFSINTVILSFFAYLVFICTKNNKHNRILMFINLFCIFGKELIFVLWQPIKLFSFDIIFSTGILSHASSTIFAIGVCSYLILLTLFGDTMLLLFLERHFLINIIFNSKAKRVRIFIYLVMVLTYMPAVILNAIFIMNGINDDRILKILDTQIPNISTQLGIHSSMVILDAYDNKHGTAFAGIYAATRFFIAIWVLYENSNYSKNPNYSKSENSRKKFKLMFQTTIFQAFTFVGFGIPCSIYIMLAVFPITFNIVQIFNLPLIYLICVGITMLYPLTFCTLAILFIKSYRNAALKLFYI